MPQNMWPPSMNARPPNICRSVTALTGGSTVPDPVGQVLVIGHRNRPFLRACPEGLSAVRSGHRASGRQARPACGLNSASRAPPGSAIVTDAPAGPVRRPGDHGGAQRHRPLGRLVQVLHYHVGQPASAGARVGLHDARPRLLAVGDPGLVGPRVRGRGDRPAEQGAVELAAPGLYRQRSGQTT